MDSNNSDCEPQNEVYTSGIEYLFGTFGFFCICGILGFFVYKKWKAARNRRRAFRQNMLAGKFFIRLFFRSDRI